MKPVPARREPADKPTRDRFTSLGGRIMSVPREEIERRDKEWRKRRKKRD